MSKEHFEKRKADILQAAKRVLMKKGFEPTTMKDIVEESGMSRGGVYQYFSSPEEMLEMLHMAHNKAFREYLDQLLRNNDSVWEALLQLVDEIDDDDNDPFGKVMYEYSVTSWRNDRHRNFMNRTADLSIQALHTFLKKGVEQGEFNPIQPLEAIVNFIFMINDGIILNVVVRGRDQAYTKEQLRGLKLYLRTVLQVGEKHNPS
ncbi:TetR family transcriptional regulator [Camelliibacillus cellulosilyticus]|uniref:TetR family transcriptional regulator n=1 Tax=Camelliibacillus cellulosilyticus TaxID=2174486 RepID=A0ABV9GJ76_9BACL